MPTGVYPRPTLADRFWPHVDRSAGPEACWPWTGYRDKDGYGNTYVRGRTTRSHRIAWEFANGPIPKDAHILHRCDNPPCCNAAHLFDGTAVANVEDMVAKRRQARGERQHLARLTAAMVDEIRATYSVGRVTQL